MGAILIRGGHVATMDPDLGALPDADVLVLSTLPILAPYTIGRCRLISGLTAGFGK